MKYIIILVALVVVLGLYSFLKNKKSNMPSHDSIHNINATELKNIISKDSSVQFIDVRTALECSRGYIKPAVNIDYMSKGFVEKFNIYKKDEPLYLYCRSGNRSRKAAQLLAEEGFTEIYDLEGGIAHWN